MAQTGAARFASIWVQEGGPAVETRHNQTSEQYQQTIDDLFSRGFRPICVSGYTVGNDPHFASIWVQEGGPAVETRANQTLSQYRQTTHDLMKGRFRPIWVSGYTVGNDPQFASIWIQEEEVPGWDSPIEHPSDQYQQAVNDRLSDGFRPICVSGYTVGNAPRFTSIWVQQGGPAVEARHNQTSDQHQQTTDDLFSSGFRPICVSGY